MHTPEEPTQIDEIVATIPRAKDLWQEHQETGKPGPLARTAYELVRGGVSANDLAVFLEESRMDTVGARALIEYIQHYNKKELDAYHVAEGHNPSASLTDEQRQALIQVCTSFREARRDCWETESQAASDRVRTDLSSVMTGE